MSQSHFRPGVSFKDGKIYVFISKYRVVVARGWPHVRAWTRTTKTQWSACRGLADQHVMGLLDRKFVPQGDPVASARQQREREAVDAYFASFPPDLLAALRRFRERRWHLASMAARCAGATDLIRSNPAMAVALSSWWIFRPGASRANEMRAIRTRVNRPQREIAEWLGFGGDESARRIMAKMTPFNCSIHRLLHLRNALEHPVMKSRLAHAPELRKTVLLIGCRAELVSLVSPTLLADPAVRGAERPYKVVEDLLALRRALLSGAVRLPDKGVQSLAQLRRLLAKVVLPITPVVTKGEEPFVVPLATPQEIQNEGLAMRTCLATTSAYAELLQHGRAQYFRMLTPERGTVMVTLRRTGAELTEARGPRNAALSPETWVLLESWFKSRFQPVSSSTSERSICPA
jgi:hypothetical protein